MGLCGCLAVLMFGILLLCDGAVAQCGCVAVWLYGYVAAFVAVWLFNCLAVRPFGCVAA